MPKLRHPSSTFTGRTGVGSNMTSGATGSSYMGKVQGGGPVPMKVRTPSMGDIHKNSGSMGDNHTSRTTGSSFQGRVQGGGRA